jgi:hypothetical protein
VCPVTRLGLNEAGETGGTQVIKKVYPNAAACVRD